MTARAPKFSITPESRPVLPRYVTLKHDRIRERWLLLAPERILIPDDIAVEVLKLCDGTATVQDLVVTLAARYSAPESTIMQDVTHMLQGLADKGFLVETKEVAS